MGYRNTESAHVNTKPGASYAEWLANTDGTVDMSVTHPRRHNQKAVRKWMAKQLSNAGIEALARSSNDYNTWQIVSDDSLPKETTPSTTCPQSCIPNEPEQRPATLGNLVRCQREVYRQIVEAMRSAYLSLPPEDPEEEHGREEDIEKGDSRWNRTSLDPRSQRCLPTPFDEEPFFGRTGAADIQRHQAQEAR
ncbi:hypothetical protein K402DRAFT_406507 [Aulographum hederae CBS 113979]|uniref:Uncharacterized protein n=1 Tax=Aulographum hederae CBS 113979 TaxID=1176131 RepID=A0A6G1GS46_9PEZI|nr:hypothetical protein K402DRAFT_406507 [Aulographum hederae CBS 113979]